MEFVVVFMTVSGMEEAEKIARKIVEEKLAGCVNILNEIRSVYSWKGEIVDDQEVMIMAKTRGDLFDSLETRVRELHSYDVPEIIAVPVLRGSEGYLDWLNAATKYLI